MHQRSLAHCFIGHLARPLLHVLEQLPLALADEVEGAVERPRKLMDLGVWGRWRGCGGYMFDSYRGYQTPFVAL